MYKFHGILHNGDKPADQCCPIRCYSFYEIRSLNLFNAYLVFKQYIRYIYMIRTLYLI